MGVCGSKKSEHSARCVKMQSVLLRVGRAHQARNSLSGIVHESLGCSIVNGYDSVHCVVAASSGPFLVEIRTNDGIGRRDV